MQFNQEQAEKAGIVGMHTGAHTGMIQAKKVIASTGTKGIEFSFETNEGKKANYLNVYYEKVDGSIINSGWNILQAMMGLLRVQQLNIESLPHEAPVMEFTNKHIGLVLQKVIYSKNDNTAGYKFKILMPFNPQTMQTFKETTAQKPPSIVSAMCETLTDFDERTTQMPTQAQRENGGGNWNNNDGGFDQNMPF